MLSVPSIRLNQFGVRFYEALLSGADLQSLVGFEVLSFGPGNQTTRGKTNKKAGRVNWEFLEKRIAASEQAYQRPIIQRKIEELVGYYLQCADSGTLPAIPGSVLLVSDRRLEFVSSGGRADAGSLKLPEESGILRALDGQHRLLALHQLAEKHNPKDFQVPRRRLRQPDRRSGRRALRDDQQQAHQTEPVAPDLAGRPEALPRREPGGRA
ncbi:MAG TPA: DNA sulfur modification protein DndB [Thermoanaerobaculia bacterium]|nr:DNA sulfur modification protein DndB [Thermoanaerobaculia bacterium]